jgi:hypothetical protein
MSVFESDFMDDLEYFIAEYKHTFPSNLLPKNNLTSTDEILIIVRNANDGIKENGLDRLKDVRNYLIDLKNELSEYYGFDDDYYQHEEMLDILNSLIRTSRPKHFAKMHDIIMPGQSMALQSMSRQKGLPGEMEREIKDYVGTSPHGGRRKKRTQKKQKRRKQSRRTRVKYRRRH